MRSLHNVAKWGTGLLLLIGAALRTFWGFGGPEWSYWLGNLMFVIFLIIPGTTILFIPEFAFLWMASFGGLAKGAQTVNWGRARPMIKLTLYAFA